MLLHRNLVNVAIALNLQYLAISVINVFVPLLLLEHGVRLWGVCLFYLGYAVCKLIVNYPSIVVIHRFGARAGLMLALCSSAAYLLSLNALSSTRPVWTLVATAITLALTNAFIWNAQHIHFARVLISSRRGKDLAAIEVVSRIVGLVAPLIGGLALAAGGQRVLLLTAVGLTLVALLPARRIHIEDIPRGQRAPRYSLRPAPARDLVANFCFNTQSLTASMVWPAYLASVVSDYAGIGLINTISTLLAMVLLWMAGQRGDSGRNRRVLAEATAMVSVVHLARLFALNPVVITGVGGAASAAGSYQQVPWTSAYYAQARDGGIGYVLAMEIAGDLAFVCSWLVLLLVSLAFPEGRTVFVVAFVVAAVLSWGVLFITAQLPAATRIRPSNPSR